MTVSSDRNNDETQQFCCPICSYPGDKIVWQSPDKLRNVIKCSQCVFTFVWPRIEQDFTNAPEEFYYANWEMLDFYGGNYIVNDVVASEGAKARYARSRSTDRPSILDAGCGGGQLLVHFRAHGWDVEGIDPWISVTSIARKYFRLPVQTCKLEKAKFTKASKDVVISIDVLQFIAEPLSFLAACYSTLKPDGMLYVTVPNFGSAESGRMGWGWHYFHPFSYINYFTARTLKLLLERAGFYRISVTSGGGAENDGFLKAVARRPVDTVLGWEDISGEVNDRDLPPLDRNSVNVKKLSPEQKFWRDNGYLIIPHLISDNLIERYCERRITVPHNEGWLSATPYMQEPSIRDLCLEKPLTDMLAHLLGEPMALHLNLTGWVSTERDWHQDDYLNPPVVNGHYAAVWTALDQITPDSGPFEFVPGSHRWPIIRQQKVLEQLGFENGDNKNWPWDSERLLTPFFEREIKQRGAKVEQFLGNKGDVLIWHARLLHRGSLPARPGAERRAMISHYSAITRRPDMPRTKRHKDGGHYFVIGEQKNSAAKSTEMIINKLFGRIKKINVFG